MSPHSGPASRRLVLIPAIITLGVTLLRLTGELAGWSQTLFNPAPGGGGSWFGIWVLVPVFGVYFALKLVRNGQPPHSGWKVAGRALIAVAGGIGIIAATAWAVSSVIPMMGMIGLLVLLTAVLLTRRAWPALYSVLVLYGLAARIPVVVVMFFAVMGDWGTHYDGPPPGFPETSPFVGWLLTGVFPQMTLWMAFTIVVAWLFGGVVAALVKPPSGSLQGGDPGSP